MTHKKNPGKIKRYYSLLAGYAYLALILAPLAILTIAINEKENHNKNKLENPRIKEDYIRDNNENESHLDIFQYR